MATPDRPGQVVIVQQLVAQATALQKAGRMADSIAPLRRAAALMPKHAGLQLDLGMTLLSCRQPEEALVALRRSVSADPKFAAARWRMGMVLETLAQTAEATKAYEAACRLDPSLSHAAFRMGVLLERVGRRAEAVLAYRQAATTTADASLRHFTTALALLLEDRDAEARGVLEEWRLVDPDNVDLNELMGSLLSTAGEFSAAIPFYEKAIASDAARIGLFYDLVRCRPMFPEDRPLLDRVQTVAETVTNSEALYKLRLGIGKGFDDLGEYESAMREFDLAEAARRLICPFDLTHFNDSIDRVIRRFSPEAMESARGGGSPDAAPILIIGMPRSGTTLMEQIITAAPGVVGAGEVRFWERRGAMLEAAGGSGIRPSFLSEAAADYVALLRRYGPDAAHVTDKNPFHFLWAGLIHLSLPNAPIIHCRRSPIDTALSIHQTSFNPMTSFPVGGDDLVGYFRGYQRLMEHWRSVIPETRFLEVDYETLVADPEPEIRRVIAFCGLPWDDACLSPEANRRFVKTPSRWQTRQPVNANSVDRWRRYEPWLGPLGALV